MQGGGPCLWGQGQSGSRPPGPSQPLGCPCPQDRVQVPLQQLRVSLSPRCAAPGPPPALLGRASPASLALLAVLAVLGTRGSIPAVALLGSAPRVQSPHPTPHLPCAEGSHGCAGLQAQGCGPAALGVCPPHLGAPKDHGISQTKPWPYWSGCGVRQGQCQPCQRVLTTWPGLGGALSLRASAALGCSCPTVPYKVARLGTHGVQGASPGLVAMIPAVLTLCSCSGSSPARSTWLPWWWASARRPLATGARPAPSTSGSRSRTSLVWQVGLGAPGSGAGVGVELGGT